MKFNGFAFGFSILLLSCGKISNSARVQEAWNWLNDPARLTDHSELRLASLPLEGALAEAQHPWSETYWPSSEGGIAARWYKTSESGFTYALNTKDQLAAMTLELRQSLSPAEKYDALQGRYDYPLVKYERQRTKPDNLGWEGLCHGWAAAALKFLEPKPVVAKNRDGIEIPFGASDIKALLVFYQGQIAQAPSRFLGSRCEGTGQPTNDSMRDPTCRDVNAGAFHVILANQLGIRKEGFVMDKNPEAEVWNHPVYAYKTKLGQHQAPSAGAAANTVEEILVETEVSYASEISAQWDPVLGTDFQNDATTYYSYRLEINNKGEVVGGEWLDSSRPDFLWTQERAKLEGYFSNIAKLL